MISDYDKNRIREDAYIARDALESLILAPTLDESYIAQKIGVVKGCVEFIECFAGETK